MLAVFPFAPAMKAQTTPVLLNAKTASLEVENKEAEVRLLAPESFRKTERLNSSELKPVRFHKMQFMGLSAAVYAAALADMHQTLHVRHYSWWSETDPLARPIVSLPAPAYYATGLAMATGLNWLSWKMGHSRRWHKLAAVPQLLSIAGNTYGYRSNCYQGY
jgi:hypothetical protein